MYDVFISHAGPDKCTIAKPLYDLLVALGLKVLHYRMEEIMDALQAVTVLTGIENRDGVTNGDSVEEVAKREYVESIGDAVEKAHGRLESGRAAGPSGS